MIATKPGEKKSLPNQNKGNYIKYIYLDIKINIKVHVLTLLHIPYFSVCL